MGIVQVMSSSELNPGWFTSHNFWWNHSNGGKPQNGISPPKFSKSLIRTLLSNCIKKPYETHTVYSLQNPPWLQKPCFIWWVDRWYILIHGIGNTHWLCLRYSIPAWNNPAPPPHTVKKPPSDPSPLVRVVRRESSPQKLHVLKEWTQPQPLECLQISNPYMGIIGNLGKKLLCLEYFCSSIPQMHCLEIGMVVQLTNILLQATPQVELGLKVWSLKTCTKSFWIFRLPSGKLT